MKLRVHKTTPARPAVELDGILNRDTVPEVRRALLRLAGRRGLKELEIDLTNVRAMDTAGVAVLVEVYRLIEHRDGILRLTHADENIRRIIRLACLDEVFGKTFG